MLTRHSLTLNRTTVYYWQRNPEAEHTILFIHGFKGNHKGLTDLSEAFDHYRTILLDLPGYGESPPMAKKHTIRNYAAIINQLMGQLGLQQSDVVGHSYGATIAIVYAALYPQSVSRLVLISPGLPQNSFAGVLASSQLAIAKIMPRNLQKAWLTSPLIEVISTYSLIKSVSRKRRMELLRLGLNNAKEQHAHVIIQGLTSFVTTPIFAIARHIQAPTFILAGEYDIISSLKSQVLLSQSIPHAKLEMIPDIGHMAHMERPRTVSRMIQHFLLPQGFRHAVPSIAAMPHISPKSTTRPSSPKQFTQTRYY